MARVSFTLRRPDSDADLGSYLRYDDAYGARTDEDSFLRADGLQTAPSDFPETFFEATSSCYGEVTLEWAINVVEVADLTDVPDITETVLVYSTLGEPQTLASGDILVESSDQFTYEHTGLVEGRWVYYSLFVHYESTLGDNYYERVASLAVIVPKNYESNLMLWNRIPEYYRNLDISIGTTDYDAACIGGLPLGGVIGPLFKYLSVIGFEIDRMRSIADYQMVAFDPLLANSEHLDALAFQLGIDFQVSDLGAKRLRSVIDDAGYFRRAKGTLSSTQLFVNAVAGSALDVDTDTGEITMYSQRVNYITDPKDGNTVINHRSAYDTEEFTPVPFSSSPSAGSYTLSGSSFTLDTPSSANHVLIKITDPIPLKLNDRACFSVQSNIGTSAIKWVRLVDGVEEVAGIQYTASTVAGSRAFEVQAVDSAGSVGLTADAYTNLYLEYLVDLSEVPEFVNELLLAERNHLGTYFDGDTIRGGWLIDSSSVSDFRWAGSANASVSLYAEDYERTKGVLLDTLSDVLPITEASKYTIVSYHAVPGF